MKTSCNRKLFARRFRETRAVRSKVHITFHAKPTQRKRIDTRLRELGRRR